MLNINKNNIYMLIMYIIVLFVEIFHFDSDIYIIIMSESFLCFTILIFMGGTVLQEMYVKGISIATLKYNYVYMYFINILNLNVNGYQSFINNLSYFLFLLIKNFKLYQNLKIILQLEYKKALVLTFIKKNLSNNNNLGLNQILSLFN